MNDYEDDVPSHWCGFCDKSVKLKKVVTTNGDKEWYCEICGVIVMKEKTEQAKTMKKQKRPITLNCDQIIWIQNAIQRVVDCPHSKLLKTTKLAALLDIMEIIGADFEDNRAAGNALHELTEFNDLRGI